MKTAWVWPMANKSTKWLKSIMACLAMWTGGGSEDPSNTIQDNHGHVLSVYIAASAEWKYSIQ